MSDINSFRCALSLISLIAAVAMAYRDRNDWLWFALFAVLLCPLK